MKLYFKYLIVAYNTCKFHQPRDETLHINIIQNICITFGLLIICINQCRIVINKYIFTHSEFKFLQSLIL